MTRLLFFRLVSIILPLLFNSAQAQPDRFAYAVTAVNKGGVEWVAFRKLDMRTGEFGSILLNVHDNDQNPTDNNQNMQGNSQPAASLPNANAYASQLILNSAANASAITNPQPGTGNSIAAIAYDRKSNRLYYTPMNMDQLHYIDLSTMEVHVVADQFFSKAGKYDFKNAGPINRMVIAPDDYGYTITNDGTHLIRFSTKESPVLTDLGDLLDNPMNKEMSIHSVCANSGGDLLADDAGHLYLITGSNKVFKVDIATKITTYIATISGLPQKFTTSGVAVSESGTQIIVSSSLYSDDYFIVDPETWTASAAQTTHEMFESADLANSNVLFTKTAGKSDMFVGKYPGDQHGIRVFPNPVMDDVVSIQFSDLPPGNYTIQLADILGSKVTEQKATITSTAQTETMHIPRFATQEFCYIRILNEKSVVVSIQKLVVERW